MQTEFQLRITEIGHSKTMNAANFPGRFKSINDDCSSTSFKIGKRI